MSYSLKLRQICFSFREDVMKLHLNQHPPFFYFLDFLGLKDTYSVEEHQKQDPAALGGLTYCKLEDVLPICKLMGCCTR